MLPLLINQIIIHKVIFVNIEAKKIKSLLPQRKRRPQRNKQTSNWNLSSVKRSAPCPLWFKIFNDDILNIWTLRRKKPVDIQLT
jgi:hypothetical protein